MAETAQRDAVEFLQEQHDQIRTMFEDVLGADADARRDAFEPLVRLLAVHETAEELVIYPALRGAGAEAVQIVEARLAEEDQAKKDLADLEKLDPSTPEFVEQLRTVRKAVEAHAAAEERHVFPLLAEVRDDEELRRMAAALVVAEGIAPTHPHKTAPESAIGNALVGPFVAMVDRARDAIRAVTR